MADAVGITIEVASARLQLYLDAEEAVLSGQSYRFADGREVTYADLEQIRLGITQWSGWVDRLNPNQRALPQARAVGRMRSGSYRSR